MLYKMRGRQGVHILLSSRSINSCQCAPFKQLAVQTSDVDLGNVALAQCFASTYHCQAKPKLTDDLKTILRQFSDLRQSFDN